MKKGKFDVNDVLILIGGIGALVGIWLIYHPASYIVAGVALVYLGLIKAKTGG